MVFSGKVLSDSTAKIRWILALAEIIFCLIGLVLFFKKTKLLLLLMPPVPS